MVTMNGRSVDKQLFVTPASSQQAQVHLKKTIGNSRTFSSTAPYLHSADVKRILREKGTFGVWGVRSSRSGRGSDENFFKKLRIGDLVLMYSQMQFPYIGEVIAKENKPNLGLAKRLWGPSADFDLVFFWRSAKQECHLRNSGAWYTTQENITYRDSSE